MVFLACFYLVSAKADLAAPNCYDSAADLNIVNILLCSRTSKPENWMRMYSHYVAFAIELVK